MRDKKITVNILINFVMVSFTSLSHTLIYNPYIYATLCCMYNKNESSKFKNIGVIVLARGLFLSK